MISPTRTPFIGESLGAVMRRGLDREAVEANAASFAESLSRITAEQADATAPGRTSSATVPENDTLPPIGADRSTRTYLDFQDPIPLVQAELVKLGIDPSLVKMERYDEVCVNPFNSPLTNHLIRTNFASGAEESFSIEWSLRNPKVTAVEIQRIIRTGGKLS